MTESGSEGSLLETLHSAMGGDREALERILTHIRPWLDDGAKRVMGSKLRGKARPSDLVQDASVEIVRALPSFRGTTEPEFRAWVQSILDNASRRHLRFLHAQRRHGPSRSSQLQALATEILPQSTSPVTQLEHAEAMIQLDEALGSLREDHRVVLEQVTLLGRPIVEVAKDLGRSDAAARMLLMRARAALAAELTHDPLA